MERPDRPSISLVLRGKTSFDLAQASFFAVTTAGWMDWIGFVGIIIGGMRHIGMIGNDVTGEGFGLKG